MRSGYRLNSSMDENSENFLPTETNRMSRWEFRPTPWEIAVLASVVSAVLGVFGALTNGLVIYLVAQIKKQQAMQNTDILILSLCFSDFISSVVLQPQGIAQLLTRDPVQKWQGMAAHSTAHFTITSGALSLFLLTMIRYMSVKFPFFYTNQVSEKSIFGCFITVYSGAVAVVIWVLLDGRREIRIFPAIIAVIFSFTIILQIMIFAVVQTKARNTRRQIVAVEHNQPAQVQIERRISFQRSKTHRTILYICAVYIATWLPAVLFRFHYIFHGNLAFYLEWIHIFNVVTQFHSCINPFIYMFRTSRVKQMLFRIFERQWRLQTVASVCSG